MANNQFTRVLPGTGQNLTIGAASVQSTVFGPQTFAVRLVVTGNCHVEFGVNPTAVATSMLITPSNLGEPFTVNPGSKIAVIQDGASTGICNVVEIGG